MTWEQIRFVTDLVAIGMIGVLIGVGLSVRYVLQSLHRHLDVVEEELARYNNAQERW